MANELFPEGTPSPESYQAAVNDLGVKSGNWQLSATTFGGIVEGAEDVNQAILLALATRKGSDPFRPTFGSDIFEQVDKPVNTAGPAIVRAVREAVTNWEPRAILQGVEYGYQDSTGNLDGLPSGVWVNISWRPRAAASPSQVLSLIVTQSGGSGPVGIIRILATENDEGITTELGQFILI